MANITDLSAGTWTVDAAHSELGFTARHLMVTKVRGKFNEFEATATVADDVTASSINAVVQLASVDTGSADRDAHIRSGDFFDVENNPTMTFISTEVGDDTLKGDLTIKGVTKPLELDVDFLGEGGDPWGGTRVGVEATGEISRKEFGIDFNIPLEGDKVMIGDKITLTINAEAVLQA